MEGAAPSAPFQGIGCDGAHPSDNGYDIIDTALNVDDRRVPRRSAARKLLPALKRVHRPAVHAGDGAQRRQAMRACPLRGERIETAWPSVWRSSAAMGFSLEFVEPFNTGASSLLKKPICACSNASRTFVRSAAGMAAKDFRAFSCDAATPCISGTGHE